MKKNKIVWNRDGWTVVQDADAAKHQLEISCRAEDGKVVEVRIRHNDGEESKGAALVNGKNILPAPLADFVKAFDEGTLVLR